MPIRNIRLCSLSYCKAATARRACCESAPGLRRARPLLLLGSTSMNRAGDDVDHNGPAWIDGEPFPMEPPYPRRPFQKLDAERSHFRTEMAAPAPAANAILISKIPGTVYSVFIFGATAVFETPVVPPTHKQYTQHSQE